MSGTKNRLIQFLETNFLIDYDKDFFEDTDLFREGLIDSFGYVELVKFLREEFLLQLKEADLVSDNLNSLSNILNRLKLQNDEL